MWYDIIVCGIFEKGPTHFSIDMQVLTDLKRCLQQYAVFAQDEILILTVFAKIVARRGTGPRTTNRLHVPRHNEDRPPRPTNRQHVSRHDEDKPLALRTDSTFQGTTRTSPPPTKLKIPQICSAKACPPRTSPYEALKRVRDYLTLLITAAPASESAHLLRGLPFPVSATLQ